MWLYMKHQRISTERERERERERGRIVVQWENLNSCKRVWLPLTLPSLPLLYM